MTDCKETIAMILTIWCGSYVVDYSKILKALTTTVWWHCVLLLLFSKSVVFESLSKCKKNTSNIAALPANMYTKANVSPALEELHYNKATDMGKGASFSSSLSSDFTLVLLIHGNCAGWSHNLKQPDRHSNSLVIGLNKIKSSPKQKIK